MEYIERVPETSLVRLGYEGDVATAREPKAEQLTERTFKLLLRSTNVLRALFHRAGVEIGISPPPTYISKAAFHPNGS